MRDEGVGAALGRLGLLFVLVPTLLTVAACSLLAPTDEELFGEGGSSSGSGGTTTRSSTAR
ncbi:MAG TPA: hypothetical protein VKP30_01115 [Polyangiaceae bacterium]|nr:hypothetical protein [Polyangiaceae bacterium]